MSVRGGARGSIGTDKSRAGRLRGISGDATHAGHPTAGLEELLEPIETDIRHELADDRGQSSGSSWGLGGRICQPVDGALVIICIGILLHLLVLLLLLFLLLLLYLAVGRPLGSLRRLRHADTKNQHTALNLLLRRALAGSMHVEMLHDAFQLLDAGLNCVFSPQNFNSEALSSETATGLLQHFLLSGLAQVLQWAHRLTLHSAQRQSEDGDGLLLSAALVRLPGLAPCSIASAFACALV